MSKVAQLLVNPVVAQVNGVDNEVRLALSNAMSYQIEGYEHMGGGAGWDGRSTLYDWNTNKFPAGFQATAEAVLKQAGYEIQLVKKPLPPPLGPMPTQALPIVDDFAPDPRYDYQFRAPQILEKHGSFIARCATGAGKSRIAKLCILRIGRKTLFLTSRQVLLYQMGDALDEAGRAILAKLSDKALLTMMGAQIADRLKRFTISYIGDGSWDTSGDVVLGMVKTLSDRLTESPDNISMKMSPAEIAAATERWRSRRDQALNLLHSIEFVIGEEAHESGGNGYFTVLKNCRRAAYRLALTGTPLMRDGESNARLIAMFGPIRLEVSEKQLIDCGILARPIFKIIDAEAPPTLKRGSAWQKADDIGIVNNVMRNKRGCAEAIRAARWGLTTMILVKRKTHGALLKTMLTRAGMRVEYIFGDSAKKKRDQALKDIKAGKLDILIGSTILDVGVDVPAIGMLILMGGGKAEVATRQRIGRGLRAKKTGPNVCYVIDFNDRLNKHLLAHSRQRHAILEQTPGFAENILPKGKDFDFAGDGFVLPANDNLAARAAA